jgi:hypothetical protein
VHILIGIGLFLALLYHWLHGRWFARVVTFVIFLVLVWTITDLLILDRIGSDKHMDGVQMALSALVFLVGGAASWLAASTPAYYWRHYWQRLDRSAGTSRAGATAVR